MHMYDILHNKLIIANYYLSFYHLIFCAIQELSVKPGIHDDDDNGGHREEEKEEGRRRRMGRRRRRRRRRITMATFNILLIIVDIYIHSPCSLKTILYFYKSI